MKSRLLSTRIVSRELAEFDLPPPLKNCRKTARFPSKTIASFCLKFGTPSRDYILIKTYLISRSNPRNVDFSIDDNRHTALNTNFIRSGEVVYEHSIAKINYFIKIIKIVRVLCDSCRGRIQLSTCTPDSLFFSLSSLSLSRFYLKNEARGRVFGRNSSLIIELYIWNFCLCILDLKWMRIISIVVLCFVL